MLIEDEPGIVDFMVRGLTLAGYHVESAPDGERGLQLALGENVDLVVLDLMLPRMSGNEVLHRLVDHRPGLPMIVVTARGELEDRVGGLKAGAVDYLVKPFAMDELERGNCSDSPSRIAVMPRGSCPALRLESVRARCAQTLDCSSTDRSPSGVPNPTQPG